MTVRLERLEKGKLDHECVWLMVIVATAIVVLAWLFSPLPTPKCVFHSLTGVPCLTCGGTRSAHALLAGDLIAAAQWNPLAAAGVLMVAGFAVYALTVVVLRLPRIRLELSSRAESLGLRATAVVLIVANWAYLIGRL